MASSLSPKAPPAASGPGLHQKETLNMLLGPDFGMDSKGIVDNARAIASHGKDALLHCFKAFKGVPSDVLAEWARDAETKLGRPPIQLQSQIVTTEQTSQQTSRKRPRNGSRPNEAADTQAPRHLVSKFYTEQCNESKPSCTTQDWSKPGNFKNHFRKFHLNYYRDPDGNWRSGAEVFSDGEKFMEYLWNLDNNHMELSVRDRPASAGPSPVMPSRTSAPNNGQLPLATTTTPNLLPNYTSAVRRQPASPIVGGPIASTSHAQPYATAAPVQPLAYGSGYSSPYPGQYNLYPSPAPQGTNGYPLPVPGQGDGYSSATTNNNPPHWLDDPDTTLADHFPAGTFPMLGFPHGEE